MAQKQAVLLGTQRIKQGTTGYVDKDIITNVSYDLWLAMGSPVLDPDKLLGKPQENQNGQFQYPKTGTFNGKTVTVFTDQTTPAGAPQTFQMQIPDSYPVYLLDKFFGGLTPSGLVFTHIKVRGGLKTPIGSTAVAST